MGDYGGRRQYERTNYPDAYERQDQARYLTHQQQQQQQQQQHYYQQQQENARRQQMDSRFNFHNPQNHQQYQQYMQQDQRALQQQARDIRGYRQGRTMTPEEVQYMQYMQQQQQRYQQQQYAARYPPPGSHPDQQRDPSVEVDIDINSYDDPSYQELVLNNRHANARPLKTDTWGDEKSTFTLDVENDGSAMGGNGIERDGWGKLKTSPVYAGGLETVNVSQDSTPVKTVKEVEAERQSLPIEDLIRRQAPPGPPQTVTREGAKRLELEAKREAKRREQELQELNRSMQNMGEPEMSIHCGVSEYQGAQVSYDVMEHYRLQQEVEARQIQLQNQSISQGLYY
jgi:hypothetical protein